ncbi:MAG: hypothetical protein ACI9VN_002066 [Patescibacteria group bacterium]|jgi:hypothetical protein
MKKFVFLFSLSLCLATGLSAQYGISVGYKVMNASNWENLINNYNATNPNEGIAPLRSGTAFGVDRWFRLKDYRVEFTPQLMYSRFVLNWTDLQSTNFDMTANSYSLLFNTSFYALDIEGDCNCPTFSKDGNFFSKGFFFQISPEVFYMHNRFKQDDEKARSNEFGLGIGIGAGLDIGLSDFMTLTPLFRYSYYPNVEWKDLNVLLSGDVTPSPESADKNKTDMLQFFFGVRLGFRFDELNKYGYR